MQVERGDPEREPGAKFVDWVAAASPREEHERLIEELRTSLRLKDQFLTAAAHEMRNPLAPITYALDLLERRANDPAAVSSARALISRQVAQLRRFVNDLLDLSRSAHGQLELRKERIDLADVASAALETAQPLIAAREHSVTATAVRGIAIVEGDPGRLTQVLANLLINAAKFTQPRGCISLCVSAEPEWASITVRDTGIGIAPHMLRNIFDVYVQGGQLSGSEKEGVGVGLTLARQLVELHGGTLRAYSEGLDKGSEFTMRLPAVQAGPLR
jgi:signal transduction histidine kinase